MAVVNPEIVERSDETAVEDEGCLSLIGVQMPVERATSVRLEGRNLEGGGLSLELTDHAARVVQHELDHLDGVLILDHTTDEARKAALDPAAKAVMTIVKWPSRRRGGRTSVFRALAARRPIEYL